MDEQSAGRVTPGQFHEATGVEDWRVVFSGACAHFRTGSFATGIALVDAIGRLAGAPYCPPMSTCGPRA
jgi:4a-hydroxytetrahydrobiopterin dehydratase